MKAPPQTLEGPGEEPSCIDIIDYVHGIGNMRAIRVAVKSGKIDKISQKMAKNDAFFKRFRQYRWNTSTYDLKNTLSQWRRPSARYCSDDKLCLSVSEAF